MKASLISKIAPSGEVAPPRLVIKTWRDDVTGWIRWLLQGMVWAALGGLAVKVLGL